jgi:flagellar hook-basal body complex protein FliE
MINTNPAQWLNPITAALPSAAPATPAMGAGEALNGFGQFFTEQLQHMNQLQQTSDSNIKAYATGADVPLHQVMIAMEQSGTAMDLAVQVRNKLLGAYQELSRMQF